MNDPVLQAVGDLVAAIESELDEPASLVTRAVVAAELIDPDGERWLRIIVDGNSKTWEVRGMLSEILADLDAYVVVGVMDEEG